MPLIVCTTSYASARNFKVFAYGTLKRGFCNHERLCRGVASIEAATARGRLYDLPFGFPALVVPETDVRASGTADYLADAARSGGAYEPRADLRGPWDTVYGELLGFDDPDVRLAALDALEGFRPGEPGLYRRVLIPVEPSGAGGPLLAWAYTTRSPSGVYLPGGRWPA